MKAASLKEIKTELSTLPREDLQTICLRLAKYKKENKELLTYLIFEAEDEFGYIANVKSFMDELFNDVNKSNVYYAKKTIRKILRIANKFIKYSGQKRTEVEILIHFCKKLKRLGIPLPVHTVLGNIYLRQYQKILKSVASLNEDLQADYEDDIRLL